MKRLLLMCSAVFLICSTSRLARAEDAGLRKEIEAAEKKWIQYWNSKNIDSLAKLYLPDAERFPPDHAIVKGRDAIRKNLEEARKDAGENKEELTTLDVYGEGDTATETGLWRDRSPEGELAEEGTYVMVWRKDDGDWKVLRETWTSFPKTGSLVEKLKPLQPFIGTWTSEGKTSDGNIRCTFTWKPVMDGNGIFTEGTVWSNGKVIDQWATVLHYDEHTKTLSDRGISLTGEGSATAHLLGNKLVFQGSGRDAEGQGSNVDEMVLDGDVVRYSQLAVFVNGKPREELLKNIEFRRR